LRHETYGVFGYPVPGLEFGHWKKPSCSRRNAEQAIRSRTDTVSSWARFSWKKLSHNLKFRETWHTKKV
jgi:hypothetical protein